MKNELLILNIVFVPLLASCLGEKNPTFDNSMDPKSSEYREYPVKNLIETDGMIDDFEDQDSVSLLGMKTDGWGPDTSKAKGTTCLMQFTRAGGSAAISPMGHMRISANYGSGTYNYCGASNVIVNGLGKPVDISGYQGLAFQFRGDPGALKVTIGSPSILDNNNAATVIESVPRDWQLVYIPFEDSLFGCDYKAGCPLLNSYLNQVSTINFNVSGWPSSSREVNIDMVQLIPKGALIPATSRSLQEFRMVNVIQASKDHYLMDFNDSTLTSSLTGVKASFWKVIEADNVSLSLLNGGAQPGSFRELKLNYQFTVSNKLATHSHAAIDFALEPNYVGKDFRKVTGIRFWAKDETTGTVNHFVRLWSDIVQNDMEKGYNAPQYKYSVTDQWSEIEIHFDQNQVCAYPGSSDCPSYSAVLEKLQTIQFIVEMGQATPLSGAFSVDNVELLFD